MDFVLRIAGGEEEICARADCFQSVMISTHYPQELGNRILAVAPEGSSCVPFGPAVCFFRSPPGTLIRNLPEEPLIKILREYPMLYACCGYMKSEVQQGELVYQICDRLKNAPRILFENWDSQRDFYGFMRPREKASVSLVCGDEKCQIIPNGLPEEIFRHLCPRGLLIQLADGFSIQ